MDSRNFLRESGFVSNHLRKSFHFDDRDPFTTLLEREGEVKGDDVKAALIAVKDRDNPYDLIASAVNKMKAKPGDLLTKQEVERMIQAAEEKMAEVRRHDIYSKMDTRSGDKSGRYNSYKSLILAQPSRDPHVKDVQRLNDNLLLLHAVVNYNRRLENKSPIAMTDLKAYQEGVADWDCGGWEQETARYKAMDTATTAEGVEWVPVAMSANLIEEIRLATALGNVFPRIPMPERAGTLDLPGAGADPTVKLVGEATSDTATKFTASTPGTRKVTLTPKKWAVRVLFSAESEEDMIIPILDYIRNQKIIPTVAEAMDDAFINGDATGAHFDADITDAEDVRKSFDGLRANVAVANDVDATNVNPSNATFTTSFLTALAAMGKYQNNKQRLFLLLGSNSSVAILNNANTVTIDKYGPQAAVLTGEVARFYGIPILISGKVRENLNASGLQDGVTTNRTHTMICHRGAFAIGEKRDLTIRASDLLYMETDQTVVVATLRMAFRFLYGTDAAVNNIFNVALI